MTTPLSLIKQEVHAEGFQVRHDMYGMYICSDEEAEYEDEGHRSVGFDGRTHYLTLSAAYRNAQRIHCWDPAA